MFLVIVGRSHEQVCRVPGQRKQIGMVEVAVGSRRLGAHTPRHAAMHWTGCPALCPSLTLVCRGLMALFQ